MILSIRVWQTTILRNNKKFSRCFIWPSIWFRKNFHVKRNALIKLVHIFCSCVCQTVIFRNIKVHAMTLAKLWCMLDKALIEEVGVDFFCKQTCVGRRSFKFWIYGDFKAYFHIEMRVCVFLTQWRCNQCPFMTSNTPVISVGVLATYLLRYHDHKTRAQFDRILDVYVPKFFKQRIDH